MMTLKDKWKREEKTVIKTLSILTNVFFEGNTSFLFFIAEINVEEQGERKGSYQVSWNEKKTLERSSTFDSILTN